MITYHLPKLIHISNSCHSLPAIAKFFLLEDILKKIYVLANVVGDPWNFLMDSNFLKFCKCERFKKKTVHTTWLSDIIEILRDSSIRRGTTVVKLLESRDLYTYCQLVNKVRELCNRRSVVPSRSPDILTPCVNCVFTPKNVKDWLWPFLAQRSLKTRQLRRFCSSIACFLLTKPCFTCNICK